MKVTQYKCNLCERVADSMNALAVRNEKYVLTVRDESDFHLCRDCIEKLENTFARTSTDPCVPIRVPIPSKGICDNCD